MQCCSRSEISIADDKPTESVRSAHCGMPLYHSKSVKLLNNLSLTVCLRNRRLMHLGTVPSSTTQPKATAKAANSNNNQIGHSMCKRTDGIRGTVDEMNLCATTDDVLDESMGEAVVHSLLLE